MYSQITKSTKASTNLCGSYKDPTEQMNARWLKIIQRKIPTIDLIDISTEINPNNSQKRQFAPEYSYKSYITMLRQEYSIGDYI